MTAHIPIQDPDAFGPEDYQRMNNLLLHRNTPREQLEEICMTLAHTPTAEAQSLLARFQKSARASEVGWLEVAIEEGQMNYLNPEDDTEERDFLALKVIQDIEDRILDLELERDRHQLRRDKAEIELEAVRSLVADGELEANAAQVLVDAIQTHQTQLDDRRRSIDSDEKTIDRIRASIRTKKYKNVDSMTMRHWHLDGEG